MHVSAVKKLIEILRFSRLNGTYKHYLEYALQIKTSLFKLRNLLGERTPKNHSAVKKDIPEN